MTGITSSRRAGFNFFGRHVALEAEDAGVVAAMRTVYARQLADGQADATVVSIGSTEIGLPVIRVAGRQVHVPVRDQLEHYAHLVLVNAAAAARTDTVVLHSGAVTLGGRAVLLVGPSGWGKSTLTLELVRRGWGFLSDDFAPVDAEGWVAPFPRAVNVTDRTLDLLGLPQPASELRLKSAGGREKWMLDIDHVFPGRLCGPSELGHIFVLAGAGLAPGAFERRWVLRVDSAPPALLAALAQLPGIQEVRAASKPTGHEIQLFLDPGARVVEALDDTCRRYGVAILAADREPWSWPDFDASPTATALDLAVGARAALTHATSLSGQRFLMGAGKTEALQALAHLHRAMAVARASVYRLEPGDLARTADLVEAICR